MNRMTVMELQVQVKRQRSEVDRLLTRWRTLIKLKTQGDQYAAERLPEVTLAHAQASEKLVRLKRQLNAAIILKRRREQINSCASGR